MSNPFASETIGRAERLMVSVESAIRMIDAFPSLDLIDLLIDSSPDAARKAHEAESALLSLRRALVSIKPEPDSIHYPKDWL